MFMIILKVHPRPSLYSFQKGYQSLLKESWIATIANTYEALILTPVNFPWKQQNTLLLS